LNILKPGSLERLIGGIQLVQLQLFLSPFQHHILQHLLQCKVTAVRVLIVAILGRVVGMGADAFEDIDELHPLLFRRGAPTLEPPLVEAANDIIERVSLFFAAMPAAWIRVLWVEYSL